MKVPFSPAAFILPVWKAEGHALTFGVNVLMLRTFDIWTRSINYDCERRLARQKQIACGSTQTYEHNTSSPLRKSTLQQSKQEAKVSNDQTAPICCSQPSENTDRSNSLNASTIWIALKIALQVRTEAAFNGDCKCQPYDEYHELNTRECTLREKKVECVYTTKITSSSSQQAWRYCSQIEYKASSLHLESMYWMSLRIALDASW